MGCQKLTYQKSFTSLKVVYNNMKMSEKGRIDCYRYGFNGMEKDDEMKGAGNSYDFGARLLDPRLGRWLKRDPLEGKYADFSPYSFVGNMPIIAIDPDGKRIVIIGRDENGNKIEREFNPSQGNSLKDTDPQFIKDTYAALQTLYEKKALEIMVGEDIDNKTSVNVLSKLIADKDIVRIEQAAVHAYARESNKIWFAPKLGAKIRKDPSKPLEGENEGRNSPMAALAHELIHRYNDRFDKAGYLARKEKDCEGKPIEFGEDGHKKGNPNCPFPDKEEEYVTLDLGNQVNKKLDEDERADYRIGDLKTATSTTTKTTEEIQKNKSAKDEKATKNKE